MRKAQRQATAKRRRESINAIIAACQNPNKSKFHQLIRKQRREPRCKQEIDFGEHHLGANESESWRNYFHELATPVEDESFNNEHLRHLNTNYLLKCLTKKSVALEPATDEEIRAIIAKLKNNKAADTHSITAEHIKQASPEIVNLIKHLVNCAITSGSLPQAYKFGCIRPVHKKGKNAKLPSNYRRITISSIIGKITEIYMVEKTRLVINKKQNSCQFGFTAGVSPTYAALVFSEVIAESKDSGEPAYIAVMDTSKAFDVVNHYAMLNSLDQHGLPDDLWSLYDSLYSNIQSAVLWEGVMSSPFPELQGIRQGGSSSADLYKCGRNSLLNRLESFPAKHIGNINTSAIMVADDLLLCSDNKHCLQASLNVAEYDASCDRYKFNTEKTKIMKFNKKDNATFQLNQENLGTSEMEKHIGIERNPKGDNSSTIASRITSARRTVFSLLGAGFTGLNGMGPATALKCYTTYVVPVLTYGLEAVVLTNVDLKALRSFQNNILRRIQHLPESTAIESLYLLTGTLPIEATIHVRILCMLRNILAAEAKSPPAIYIRELIVRQLAMKDDDSNSWAVPVRKLLLQYELPSINSIVECPPKKTEWKTLVKKKCNLYWTKQLRESCKDKKTLKYLDVNNCATDKLHPIWQYCNNTLDVKKATVKVKLLVRRYPLTTCHTSGKQKSDICPLCKVEPETVVHFLLQCPVLSDDRSRYIEKLLCRCRQLQIDICPENLVSLILDSNNYTGLDKPQHEALTRNLIFKLHNRRSTTLGVKSCYTLKY